MIGDRTTLLMEPFQTAPSQSAYFTNVVDENSVPRLCTLNHSAELSAEHLGTSSLELSALCTAFAQSNPVHM